MTVGRVCFFISLLRFVSHFRLSIKWDVRVGGWALLDANAVLRML